MKQANAAFYGQGRRYAGAVARHAERGAGPRAALRRAAADLGLDVGTVRSAVAFETAVDLVVGNAGPAAEDLILGGDRRPTPRQVARLARTHPDRQRYEVAQGPVPLGDKPPRGPRLAHREFGPFTRRRTCS